MATILPPCVRTVKPSIDNGVGKSLSCALIAALPIGLGPVHTNGSNVLSLAYGTHRSSIRTNRRLPARPTRQRKHIEPPGAQCHPVRGRAGLQVARVASPIRQMAHRLHSHEPLVQERCTRQGIRTPATGTDSAYQARGYFARQHDRQGTSRRHGCVKKNGPQAIGKSRGGWTTKIHMVAADARTAMTFSLSPGQAHDAPEGRKLLSRLLLSARRADRSKRTCM